MARFDVYRVNRSNTLLVDVQSDHVDIGTTRVVVPMRATRPSQAPVSKVTPTLLFDNEPVSLVTPLITSVELRTLRSPIGSLADQQDIIKDALDRLLFSY